MIRKLFKLIFYFLLLGALFIAVGVLFPAPNIPNLGISGNLYIQNANIVDVVSGEIIPSQNLLVRDGTITGISDNNIRPKDELVIIVDATDKFLIPGLWDMHTQSLKRSPYFHHPLFIANGVTHVRDLSGCLDKNDAYWACTEDRKHWAKSASQAKTISPYYHQHTIFPLNGGSEVPDSFRDVLKADSIQKSLALANFAQMNNADFITLKPGLKKRPYYGIAVETAKKGITLSGAKPFDSSLQEALSTYQSSIDEPTLFATECYTNANDLRMNGNYDQTLRYSMRQKIIDNQDNISCSALMTAMASSYTWWTPTLAQLQPAQYAENNIFPNSGLDKYIPLATRYGMWKISDEKTAYKTKSGSRNIHSEFFDLVKNHTSQASLSGIRLMAGTNSMNHYTYSGFSLHDELNNLVEAGLSPLKALRTATTGPAAFSNLSNKFGNIKIGMQADFVLLNANPLAQIDNIRNIDSVITQQQLFDREALDSLLAFSEKQASNWHMNIKLGWDAVKSPLMRHQLRNDYEQLKN